ncbi:MAG: peptidylprolyl isomerase [bacterium]
MEFLYSLVAEKLLAQRSMQVGGERDSVIQILMTDVTRKLARDQLYREEIQNTVSVTRDEISKGIVQAKRLLVVSYLFFKNKADADVVRKQIRDERTFDQILIDTSIVFMRDTISVSWGEAETSIDQAAFHMKRGEISLVVRASTGYYILKLQREDPNIFYTGMASGVLRRRVEDKIRLRKEEMRMNAFLNRILPSKIGEAQPIPFKVLAKELTAVLRSGVQKGQVSVTDSLLDILQKRCISNIHDTLITMAGASWELHDVLQKLRGGVFTVEPKTEIGIALQLNIQLKAFVQQYLLENEALLRGLHQRPSVKKQIEMWRDYFLAQQAESEFAHASVATEEETWVYVKRLNYPLPEIRIQELHTASLDTMERALNELAINKDFGAVIQRWSSNEQARALKGISPYFTPIDRQPVGIIAWTMKIGERHGPIKTGKEYLYFELLEKKYRGVGGPDSLEKQLSLAREAMQRMKQQQAVDEGIARLVKEQKVDVFQDRVKKLSVSPSPMMTFRVLGFGGRMIAVPFVKKQINWLNSKSLQPALVP